MSPQPFPDRSRLHLRTGFRSGSVGACFVASSGGGGGQGAWGRSAHSLCGQSAPRRTRRPPERSGPGGPASTPRSANLSYPGALLLRPRITQIPGGQASTLFPGGLSSYAGRGAGAWARAGDSVDGRAEPPVSKRSEAICRPTTMTPTLVDMPRSTRPLSSGRGQ